MKKLLVLMLVLGLASAANATLTDVHLYVSGGDEGTSYDLVTSTSITVDIYSGNTDSGNTYIGFEQSSLRTIGTITVTTNAGDSGGYVGPYSTYGYDEIELTSSQPAGTPQPGVHMTVQITAGTSTGAVDVYLKDDSTGYPTVDTLTLNIVPEPVTIALLGLGGLFLRRRR